MPLPIDKTYLLEQLRNFKTIILDPDFKIQKTALPTASEDNEGAVFQYVGTDSTNYTIGGFYQCQEVTPVTDPKTYTWVKVNGSPVDDALSDTSTNPVQNKVITEEFGNIGTILFGKAEDDSTSITVPDNTITATYSVELPKGVWLVIGWIDWEANINGYRQIQIIPSDATPSVNPTRDSAVTSVPHSLNTQKEHYMQIVRIFNITSTNTINLYALQTSGGNLIAFPKIEAIRIR